MEQQSQSNNNQICLEYENVFDASKYPELDAELVAILKSKVTAMRGFMDRMIGGVRQMRSTVDYNGSTYLFTLSLTA